MSGKERRPVPEDRATASMQFKVDQDTVPWLYAALMNGTAC